MPEAGGGFGHWVELLANGLTFDLAGLAPGGAAFHPPDAHRFGVSDDLDESALEPVLLQPGPHLAGGGGMIPIVRTVAALTAELARLPGVRAIVWHPARCWSAPEQFRRTVMAWLEGGPFPVFSLAALSSTSDGGMQSEGLSLFTGQELRLEPELAEDRSTGAKIAVRVLHRLSEQGPLTGTEFIAGPDGRRFRLEPSVNQRFVRVWKV